MIECGRLLREPRLELHVEFVGDGGDGPAAIKQIPDCFPQFFHAEIKSRGVCFV